MNKIGIIGGSGLYEIEGFEAHEWVPVDTPFGSPSDEFLTGQLKDRDVVFLPRHGRGHRIMPSELNHRANIWAMKQLGVSWIISASAVGSLQPQYTPCDIVLIDQFIDNTKQSSTHTFFGGGIVGHVTFAEPVCEELRTVLLAAADHAGVKAHDRGSAPSNTALSLHPIFDCPAQSHTSPIITLLMMISFLPLILIL